ncbi:hypothetical protein KUTeg_008546 [Tegillarca granosa]|uniref:Peroxidase n=1 Tax=Tegillarca granosa TaxID=220873 RepID=A0ABQ9F9H1_TEGGR|nr:hypothetical protein KUTeg_008546 [Tegillarca granosa]
MLYVNQLHVDYCLLLIECLPIELPAGDKRFKNKKCMNFKRSASGPLLGTSCTPEPRQQINQITSFIDASNVYGSSEEEVETLRDESQREFLKIEGSDFPPSGDENSCRRSDKKFHCLKAEHNRIAAMLTGLNSRWDGDRTFQETRKIIGAMLQHITYTEYLPKVLGSKLADEKGFIASKADFYDKSLNPSISNEFAVAAFRFGHSQINDHLRYYDSFFEPGRREALLRNQFDDVSMLQNNEGRRVPEVARWMVTEKSREVDRFFEEEVRDWTFKEFDLVALNIQRGRDHGIPPYSKWRLYCGLSELTDWNSLKTDHDPETIEKLKEVYGNPEDIDLYVGGVSEKHISGASVGPTFACILQEQFIRLKYGDRFWYDRNDEWDPVVGFSKGIREPRTLSKIDGSILTSPRIISNTFLAANDSDPQTTSDTVMLMAWGQFLAHDMVLTPESSGDERVNTVPNLIMMHLMFAREHNRIVDILGEYHSGWGEKKKFQEARKIVGALMQHITYSEYLPKILSQTYMDSNGLGNTANDPYDTSVNPGIINGYGSAAGRHFEEEVRNWLFFDLDLSALNIQRGRDHGLPSYTEWRTFCGLSAINSWDDMSPTDVDFYVGGISEIHVPGASVGPTFACVINKQFESLKKGDRFWYERNDSMDSVVGLSSGSVKNLALFLFFLFIYFVFYLFCVVLAVLRFFHSFFYNITYI